MARTFFLSSGVLYLALGLRLGSGGVLMVWLGLSLLGVGVAYTRRSAWWMGKRADGTFHPLGLAVHAPYLAAAWFAWQLRRRRSEAAWNEVAPRLYVGRMATFAELPPGVPLVVDLTCELVPPPRVRRGAYRCLPTLDGCAPDAVAFRALVTEAAGWEGPVFIHCAAGHGRSATLAAAVMLKRGLAADVDEAETKMRLQRPLIALGDAQKRMVADLMSAT